MVQFNNEISNSLSLAIIAYQLQDELRPKYVLPNIGRLNILLDLLYSNNNNKIKCLKFAKYLEFLLHN